MNRREKWLFLAAGIVSISALWSIATIWQLKSNVDELYWMVSDLEEKNTELSSALARAQETLEQLPQSRQGAFSPHVVPHDWRSRLDEVAEEVRREMKEREAARAGQKSSSTP